MIDCHELLIIFILGIVEGLTEFLPVSSAGHMILIGYLLEFNSDRAKIFEVVVQFGTILSVIVKFWRKLFSVVGIRFNQEILDKEKNSCLSLWHILLGVLPIIVLGFLFYNQIKFFFELIYVMNALLVGSLLLLVAEYFAYCSSSRKISITELSYMQAFFIGCFQCFALCPGFSRSGATVSGGLLMGVSRHSSFEFSFFLAVPVIFGASILDLYKNISLFTHHDVLLFFVGFCTSFVVGLCSIKYFLQMVKNISLIPFVVYRFILAGIIYWLVYNP
ncbi:undecaprenyl-diphosphate phosphatase [Blochmannia endosymbiont of Camponotus (Colobopsis) obliquus]|uniref:undecaprenyl-diphosphate phosphatase n=1 Tax=Blochmannia endosymbiont of Camponotus (Colobopsis) obliquus TaxID=1505597 RepID=UPI00061A7186|nr:undecaprenyl-diphosphate phosphatase [Blochmannia endosymbiont of Camponotus (Colobopsis) obliquus]AKC60243.1 Undecaprenyl-diphosphatase [Blochmannia endosymbiont of Camponotus (Colobopsis) obliquus]